MERGSEKLTIEIPDHGDIEKYLHVFRTMLYSMTFHPETITEYIPED
jgi:hypothetical protein